MPRLPGFGAHHEQAEIASRLHDRAELELAPTDPESIRLERIAAGLEAEPGFVRRLAAGLNRVLRFGDGSG